MKSFARALPGLLLVLVTLAVVAAIGWLGVSWFLGLAPTTQTPVAALTGVVLAPLIAFVTSRVLERRRSLDASLRDKKTQLYDEMVKGLMSILDLGGAARKVGKNNTGEILKFFVNMTPRMITYASPRVIKAWNGVRLGAARGASGFQTLANFEDMLKAMRADLGHRTWLQPRGELLSLWVNDVHTIDWRTMSLKPEFAKPEAAEEE
jgi:hypothetical protein